MIVGNNFLKMKAHSLFLSDNGNNLQPWFHKIISYDPHIDMERQPNKIEL